MAILSHTSRSLELCVQRYFRSSISGIPSVRLHNTSTVDRPYRVAT